MNGYLVNAVNLTKTFGSVTALNNFSISLPKGRIIGLLGPNGNGRKVQCFSQKNIMLSGTICLFSSILNSRIIVRQKAFLFSFVSFSYIPL